MGGPTHDENDAVIDRSFAFDEGDRVKVKAEDETCWIEFIAECEKIETFPTGRTQATFDLPGMMNHISLATNEAYFEVIDGE